MDILTEQQNELLRGMSLYWDDVFERVDQTPLIEEVEQVVRVLGPIKLLKIIQKEIK